MLLLVGSITASLSTRTLIDKQEEELLSQRAAVVELVLRQLVGQIQSSLQSLATVVSLAGTDQDAFTRSVAGSIGPTSAVAIVEESAGSLRVVVRSGADSNSPTISSYAMSTISAARGAQGFASTPPYMANGQRRIAFVFASPILGPSRVIYLETPLQAAGQTQVRSSAFSELSVGVYSGEDLVPEQLVLSTTRELPSSGMIDRRAIQVGSSRWTATVSPRGNLVGPLTAALPWLVLGGGVLLMALMTSLVETIGRRRDDALALVDERSEETESILDAAEDAFISMNAQGEVIRWNRKASELFGWSLDEVVGKRVAELVIPPSMRDQHERGITTFLETGHGPVLNTRVEVIAMRRDGSVFPVELAIWPSEREGSYVFNAFLHDITTRRRAAEELERAHEQAVQASRLKSEFLANMSHEIRTPMNGVIGMTGLLLRTDLNDEQREYAETVRASAEALLNVINDILDFSKIEAGRLELEFVDFEVRRTMEEAADLMAERAHSKGLELIASTDADVPTALRGDAGRLRQVLINLLGNAIKFTERGEVVLRCSVEQAGSQADGVMLRFSVSDTGIGISDADRMRIFESFTQLDASTTKRHEGTGLGLAIVRQLTTLMGGKLGVESEKNVGSTFWFTVRLEHSEGGVSKEPASAADLVGVRVLVVDDNATNTEILMRTVLEWGMRPECAKNAGEALEHLAMMEEEGDPCRLVLLDYHMPDVDGLSVARAISNDPRHDGVRTLLLTSSGDHIDRATLSEVNVVDSMTKPVRHDLLKRRMAETLRRVSAPEHREQETDLAELRLSYACHVLVAEDNSVNQRVASRMLEKLGCTVDVVANGQEAVTAVERQEYSVVFMDCQMPEKDGYQATREIRAGHHSVPIVAMTAGAMQGDRELAIDAGMDDYLPKPVQLVQLYRALEQWAVPPADLHQEGDEMTEPNEVLDLTIVEGLLEIMTEDGSPLLAELVERFHENANKQIEDLKSALEEQDAESMARIAHMLRGSSSTLGAKELGAACSRLETAVNQHGAGYAAVAGDVFAIERLLETSVRSLSEAAAKS